MSVWTAATASSATATVDTADAGLARAAAYVRLRPRPDRRRTACRDHLRRRICAEYVAMPGLHITAHQAARLLSIDSDACQRVLEECVEDGWLARVANGTYTLARLPEPSAPRSLA